MTYRSALTLYRIPMLLFSRNPTDDGGGSAHLQMPQESSSAFHVHVATACHSSIFTFMLEGARYVFPGAGVRTASATTARSAAPRFPANSLHTAGPPRPAAS